MKYGIKEDGYISTIGELPNGFKEVTEVQYRAELKKREGEVEAELTRIEKANEELLQSKAKKRETVAKKLGLTLEELQEIL